MSEIRAKKSLGQNFLKDEHILESIANSFEVSERDLIIEVGPGKGALTKHLIRKNCSFLCYELDERMKSFLLYFESEKCHIIFDDFLKRDIEQDINGNYEHIYVIANIPYYITTPIIEHFLNSSILIDGMTLLVQKEVAHRFAALPGGRDYGYFTVYLQHFFDIQILFDVSPKAFTPEPKVWSSVVRFVSKESINEGNVVLFQKFLKQAFAQKRKKLKNNLKGYSWNSVLSILEKNGFDENVRAEELSYEVFWEIFKKVSS